MKTLTPVKFCAAVLFTAGIGLTSCEQFELPLPIKSNDKVFKTEIFKKKLQESLQGARGYQFVITHKGQVADTAAYGIGSTSGMAADVNGFVNIASVTKTLTAVTVLKYLDAFTIDDKIGPWLPSSWSKHSHIANLTFKQLLTHKSGIRGGNTSWSTLMSVVGSKIDSPKTYSYSNINFALFRAMIPKLHDSITLREKEKTLSAVEFRRWMSSEYIRLVNAHIIMKAGGSERGCAPVKGRTLQMMNEAPSRLDGAGHDDWTELCGGGGFVLTTMDMSRIITYLAEKETYISANKKLLMDTYRLGWVASYDVYGGKAFAHDGALYMERNGKDSLNVGDIGLQTLIVKLPARVQLAVSVNSVDSTWRGIHGMVRNAYNASWVKE
ncbi:serine hydrolase domain-containing protein [Chitinophaga barathri]|uniref:Class C beta-lactamase-related serine hydrolase n=1 Tax=Chitinophaga barathri TaxID=1647451 RepID=A0A3N4M8E5_9BACT|nr:serine hydrolase [Chitinophaga barathri]RPD39525.1 class C beta-lactamase-related serine hydrolase [Chitinophaga barathri]